MYRPTDPHLVEREASYRFPESAVGRTVRLNRPVLSYGEVVGGTGTEWRVTGRHNAGFRGIEVSLVATDGTRIHNLSAGAVTVV